MVYLYEKIFQHVFELVNLGYYCIFWYLWRYRLGGKILISNNGKLLKYRTLLLSPKGSLQPPAPGNNCLVFCHHRLALQIQDFQINRPVEHVSCAWLLPVVARICTFYFHCWVVSHCATLPQFVYVRFFMDIWIISPLGLL